MKLKYLLCLLGAPYTRNFNLFVLFVAVKSSSTPVSSPARSPLVTKDKKTPQRSSLKPKSLIDMDDDVSTWYLLGKDVIKTMLAFVSCNNYLGKLFNYLYIK